jgi:hypothetical protein
VTGSTREGASFVTQTMGSAEPAKPGAHPPKPRLALRVGISGHRPKPEKLPREAFPRVLQRLRDVFGAIDAALIDAKRENADFFAGGPDEHDVHLVSGVAEGVDQMAIAARPSGWRVEAILPFPKASYLRDFEKSAIDKTTDVTADFETALAQADAVVQLPEDPRIARNGLTPEKDGARYWPLRNLGYANLGEFLLRQIDILVAVWDGRPEDGPGGTAAVVRDAVAAGIPVVWIEVKDGSPPAMIESIDDEQRAVKAGSDYKAALRRAVSTVVSVPKDSAIQGDPHASHIRGARERLTNFLNETWPKPTRAVTYDVFRNLTRRRPLRFRIPPEDVGKAYDKPWADFITDAADAGRLDTKVKDTLLPRYMWADALAVERSHWYRAAYFNSYLLAAITVLVALLGMFSNEFVDGHERRLIYKVALVAVELGLIGIIIGIVRRGWRSHGQEAWVEYRALAEMLRSTRTLAYLGLNGGIQRAGALEPASSAWFLWYFRATIRELGLPNAVLDEPYLRRQLETVRKHVVQDQLGYHIPNIATSTNMHRWIKGIRDWSFIATAAVLAAFLVSYLLFVGGMLRAGHPLFAILGWDQGHGVLPYSMTEANGWAETLGMLLYGSKSYVTFAAAFLPALGAAFAGIQETGDFEGLALRSAKTANALQEIDNRITQIIKQPTLETTGPVFLSTAEVLTEDLGAWQSIYGRKHLGLP